MAGKGFDQSSKCDGCNSSTNILSFRVSVRQVLCDNCAERNHDRILHIDEPVTCPCKNHATVQASVCCRSHDVWLCHECAFKFHQRPCEAVEINDEISKRKQELSEILTRARAKVDALEKLGKTTDRNINLAEGKLASLDRQVFTAREEELRKVEEERTKETAVITREADEGIRQIIEARDNKLHLVDEIATRERRLVEEGSDQLQGSINQVDRALQSRSKEIKWNRLKVTTALAHSTDAAEMMADQGRYIANDFHPIASSLEDSTMAEVDIGRIKQITSIASEISFCRIDGPVLGKVYASKERWEKAHEFYPSMGRCFEMKGSLNQEEVLLQDIASGSVNVTSLTSKCMKHIEAKNIEQTFSCTSFHEKMIVCGTKDGTVVIYDTKWKPMRTINVTPKHHPADILVSVEKNGLVLAAVKSEARIKLYNPDDGKLVGSIAVSGDRQIQEMHTLSSGCIAILAQCLEGPGPDVCVLQDSGTVQSTYPFHGKTVHSIAVDQASDAIYVMSSDRGHLVVHVMKTQDMRVTELAEMRVELKPAWYYQTCVIPKTGSFVICHHGKLLVFKQVSQNRQLDELLGSDELFASATHQDIYV